MKLRQALVQFLEGLRDDLSAEWNAVLDEREPDFTAVEGNLMFQLRGQI
jgi:hypothetical protein